MRNSLTDIHNQLSAADQVYLEKHAEQIKIAEEEDAAGRIMARGFADELTKLAEPAQRPTFSPPVESAGAGGNVFKPGDKINAVTGANQTGKARGAGPSPTPPAAKPPGPAQPSAGAKPAVGAPKPGAMGTGRGMRANRPPRGSAWVRS